MKILVGSILFALWLGIIIYQIIGARRARRRMKRERGPK